MLTIASKKRKLIWENNQKDVSTENVEKEVLALLLPLQAREQNEILVCVAAELQRTRKESIVRRGKELRYLRKNERVGRTFWRRLL